MQAKILVVDDEDSIRFTFNIFLSEENHAVSAAANYEEAMALLAETEFDLIFLDIVMEGKSGIDLLKAIRQHNPQIPVVMITGVPSIETAAESLRMGALDYIIKPIRQDTLLRATNVALTHRALSNEKEKCRLHMEAIFRSVKDGIITVDDDLRIVEMNEAAAQICGVRREDALGKTIPTVSDNCQGNCVEVLHELFRLRKPVEIRYVECRSSQRRRRVVSLTASPLLEPQKDFPGGLMVIRDETRLVDLERSLREREEFDHFVGQSEGVRKAKSLIKDLADVPTTVLVTGESGTGKELVVEALHRSGERREAPLVKVNCAALSENLLESELFGHVAGAYTGALKDKLGRFQRADGGTIFLDEIGEISPPMQLRLLRVIETMEFERVGDSTPIKVDVRVVAATNQDLQKKMQQGEFRQDLYYRLKVVEIWLPPLRERSGDIPLLIEHLLGKLNRKFDKKIKGLSTGVWKMFMAHHWPGNVRELQNTLEHAFVRCREEVITLDHLPDDFHKPQADFSASETNSEAREDEAIRRALQQTWGNKSKAARLLGMSRRTIYRKMKKHAIASTPLPISTDGGR